MTPVRGLPLKIAAALLLAFSSLAHGQSTEAPKKVQVYFHCDCSDIVGARVGSAFRDKLASSPRYSETTSPKGFDLNVLSMDSDHDHPGNASVFSAVLTIGVTYFVQHWVLQCGLAKVDECAADVLSEIDQQVHSD